MTKLWLSGSETFFKDVYLIPPGSYFIIKDGKIKAKKQYYVFKQNENPDLPVDEGVKFFEKYFSDSVRSRLISKVPVAAFLSGGIDSSLLCKYVKDNINEQLTTYTIEYESDTKLDLKHAKKLSEKEEFEFKKTQINPDIYSLENMDEITYHMEEIMMDKVYLADYFNFKAAKKDGYTVVLHGQGGDEPWLGYLHTEKIYSENQSFESLTSFFMTEMVFSNKINPKIKTRLEEIILKYLNDNFGKSDDKLNNVAYLAVNTILHNLLLQEDKLAMAHSVEARVPYVDKDLIELSFKLSGADKSKNNKEKYIASVVSKSKLPKSIIERDKLPFPEPPSNYDVHFRNLVSDNWKQISNSKLVNELINPELLYSIDNFNKKEIWWLLNLWRFEVVFEN